MLCQWVTHPPPTSTAAWPAHWSKPHLQAGVLIHRGVKAEYEAAKMEALRGVFAFLWSLNCGQTQTLSKWGVKMAQAVWPRAAVMWARCRNDTGLVEQYHLGPSVQGGNLVSAPRCCVSACTTRPTTFCFFFVFINDDEAGVGDAAAHWLLIAPFTSAPS